MNILRPGASFLLAFALVTGSSNAAPAQTGRGAEPLALVHANVLDVRTGRIASNQTVTIRGGKIESVSAASAPAGVKTLDLAGRTLVPGLVDRHAVRLAELGGSIAVPAESVPSVGRFAVLVDPAGAHFGIMQPV